jgi:nucleoside-diphosphate-sugar epimerase
MPSRQAHPAPLRIAITGVSGFVGSHLVRQLAARGHNITALVRDRSRLSKKFPASAIVVEGALDDKQALDKLVGKAEVVVHVAGAIKAVDATEFMKVNADGTRAVVEAARRAEVTRFVHVSSLAAREPALSAYCASKAEAESIVAGSAGDMEWMCVRPPAVYGPGDRATLPLVQQLSRRHAILTGSHDQRISLLHVDDLARGLVAAAEGLVEGGMVYEADDATPEGYNWGEVARAAGHSLGFTPRVHLLPRLIVQMAGIAGGIMARITGKAQILTAGKARELYHCDWVIKGVRLDATGHWQPRMKFDEGFADTLRWYKAHGWLPDR